MCAAIVSTGDVALECPCFPFCGFLSRLAVLAVGRAAVVVEPGGALAAGTGQSTAPFAAAVARDAAAVGVAAVAARFAAATVTFEFDAGAAAVGTLVVAGGALTATLACRGPLSLSLASPP